jgi:hypothetical protein
VVVVKGEGKEEKVEEEKVEEETRRRGDEETRRDRTRMGEGIGGRTPGLGFYFTTSFHFSQISLSSRLGAWFAWMR